MMAGGTFFSLALGGACRSIGGSFFPNGGRLKARPRSDIKTPAAGQISLGVDSKRDAVLQIPPNAGESPLPLLIMLHGATQNSNAMLRYLGATPNEAGVAVLAPNSRGVTWDAIRGGFGEDVELLDRALERVFETAPIDPARIAMGGFSDGATYALSLGLINGDLCNTVVAFSPGFVIYGDPKGKPHIFISHGTHDHILPIDRCGRRVAAELKSRGYDVKFREFDGDHEVPEPIAQEGLAWISEKRKK